MPAALIDPTVHAQGPAGFGQSPIAGIMQGIIAQQAQMYPNAQEAQDIRYKNAATQKLDMENAAPGQLEQLFKTAYAPLNTGGATPADGTTPQGGQPAPQTRDQTVSSNLPQLAGAMARAGQYGQIGSMFRTFVANAPGITAVSNDPQHPSPVSMSMMGAGDAYTSTPDYATSGVTPASRDRAAKAAQIHAMHPQLTPAEVSDLTDGLTKTVTDPSTGNAFLVNEAEGTSKLLRSPAQGATKPTMGSSPAGAQPSSSATNAIGTTLGLEGGYAPTDGASGAPVIFGVNQKWFPQDFARIKQIADTQGPEAAKAAATQFYKTNFWDANKLDDLDPKVAGIVFDGLVNHSQPFGQSLLAAADAGATPEMLLKMRAKEYQRLATVNPDKYAADLPGWQNRLKTLAGTPSGGGQSQPSGAGVSPTAAPTATTPADFALKPGDLGLNFNSAYGGPATLSRAGGAISAIMGNNDANTGPSDVLGKINDINRRLIAINSTRAGMRNNVAAQKMYAQGLPESDPQLGNAEDMTSSAMTGGNSAEKLLMQRLQETAADRNTDADMLADPDTNKEERAAASIRAAETDKLFASLGNDINSRYLAATGRAPAAAPKTNLEQGTAATTVPAYQPVEGKPVVTANDIAFMAKKYSMTPAAVVEKLRSLGKVK